MNLACFPLFLDDWYPSSLFRDLCRALALQKWDVRCSTPYPGHLRVELSFDQQAFRVWWYSIWFNPPSNQAASSTSGWLPVMVFRPTSSGTDSICIEDVLSRSSYIFYMFMIFISIYDDWTASFVFGMYAVDSNILDDTQGWNNLVAHLHGGCFNFCSTEMGFTEVVLVGYGGAVGAVLHDQVLVMLAHKSSTYYDLFMTWYMMRICIILFCKRGNSK